MKILLICLLSFSSLVYLIKIFSNIITIYLVFIKKDIETIKIIEENYPSYRTIRGQILNNTEHILVMLTYILSIIYVVNH